MENKLTFTPGNSYLTRSGRTVVVHENDPTSKYSFPVKGTIYRKKNKRVTKTYNTWTADGRYSVFGEHPLDLIAIGNSAQNY